MGKSNPLSVRGRQSLPQRQRLHGVSEAENIVHIIEARRLAKGPSRSRESAIRKNRAVKRRMGQRDDFLIGCEGYFMLADDSAGAANGKTDLSAFTLGIGTVIGRLPEGLEVCAPALGCRIAQHQSRARRSVDLAPVMGLQNLDVPVFAKRLGGPSCQGAKQIDAKREIPGLHDNKIARRFGNDILSSCIEPCRPDDRGLHACLSKSGDR